MLRLSWCQELVKLDRKVRIRALESSLLHASPDGRVSKTHLVSSLHDLATLLQANGSAMRYKGDEQSHQNLVTKGLEVISLLGVCELSWPHSS